MWTETLGSDEVGDPAKADYYQDVILLHDINPISEPRYQTNKYMPKNFKKQRQTAENKGFKWKFRIAEYLFIRMLMRHEIMESCQFNYENNDVERYQKEADRCGAQSHDW